MHLLNSSHVHERARVLLRSIMVGGVYNGFLHGKVPGSLFHEILKKIVLLYCQIELIRLCVWIRRKSGVSRSHARIKVTGLLGWSAEEGARHLLQVPRVLILRQGSTLTANVPVDLDAEGHLRRIPAIGRPTASVASLHKGSSRVRGSVTLICVFDNSDRFWV